MERRCRVSVISVNHSIGHGEYVLDERTLLVVDDHGFWRALDKAYYKCIICILIALLICGSLPSLSTLSKYLYYAIIVFALIVALLIPASMTYIIDRKAHSKLNLFTRWALVNWRHISVGSSSIKATYGRFISNRCNFKS